ncbi:phosphatidylserine decarboxylase-like protein [Gymnopus androsaceus JB14]|uniref:Phosphatidylserine decarboxylase-like protein n=1 Tax=Gymnopus androsaceus JB14 TaxID=1447944 RepID=A0A6A4GRW0_9AGAR|nr:phosphatidylserine decarboxylase-like protein [Gymnopus androsaceus JB14]
MPGSKPLVHHRIGGWLPRDHEVLRRWLDKKIGFVERSGKAPRDWHPVIQEFKALIEGNPILYMDFHQMFEQVPTKPPYDKDPTGKPQVRDYLVMLSLFDHIITTAPEYEDNDLVGFPVNAILDWPMGTSAGQAAFANPSVNMHFKKMFDAWTRFLTSYDSTYVLTTADNGWFGGPASGVMPDFSETFICDPSDPSGHYGFKSWDDFFTRRFREDLRPVANSDNDDVINSGCESKVYCIAKQIKMNDKFWLKGEPYSLHHMLNGDPLTKHFEGGTIYQAFLSALSYHRWNSPVNGVVKKIVMVPGTYYLESPSMGFVNPEGPDPGAPNNSQGFITQTAARALIFIESSNPNIGLMCMVVVGMAEVSTCQVTAYETMKVVKGQEIGMFHFGGSTHCLIFRPQTNVNFEVEKGDSVLLNAKIATVSAA